VKEKGFSTIVLIIVIVSLTLSSLIAYFFLFGKELPIPFSLPTLNSPPGCFILGKSALMGGCFGKNLNRNLKISPELPSCLKISTNTCQTATLEIENLCPKDMLIKIEGEDIPNSYTYLLYGKDESGKTVKLDSSASLYPTSDEDIILEGSLDNQHFTVSYTRTKKLCD
jgi:hypothetical protein